MVAAELVEFANKSEARRLPNKREYDNNLTEWAAGDSNYIPTHGHMWIQLTLIHNLN
jgi:hypothetical protein